MRKNLLYRLGATLAAASMAMATFAQAPAQCDKVMLQGFYWDSYLLKTYDRTKWMDLTADTTEICENFDMIWLPPSAKSTGGNGYHPTQLNNQSSDWGSETLLRELIAALKRNGCYAIADVVINHRGNSNGWINFYEDDFGVYGKFAYDASHICSDDEAADNGYTVTGAKDAGYDTQCKASGGYCAARDMDHSNEYVQNGMIAYLKFLKDFGYMGWRYDLVKGYLGKYTEMYNDAADAYFSVGEYWDGDASKVSAWIAATNYKSTAFDFPMKYSAFNNSLQSNKYSGMASGGKQVGLQNKRYACTFVDNHDTFRDGNKYTGSIPKAYAYLLSAPGVPCVFWPHWNLYKTEINNMISIRKACGIHSESESSASATSGYYTCTTTGKNGTLKCFIGTGWDAPDGYTLAAEGNEWAYYISNDCNSVPYVTINTKPGYAENVTITSQSTNTIYYTLDGSEPTKESTVYTGPIEINSDEVTVRCIAISPSDVKSQTRQAVYTNIKPEPITVKVLTDESNLGTSNIHIYAWNSDGYQLSTWSEAPAMTKVEKEGNIHWEYTFPEEIRLVNIVIRSGSKQTVNYEDIRETSCFKVGNKSTTETNKYTLSNIKCKAVGIEETEISEVKLYPNPASDMVTVGTEYNVEKITIRDLGARTVMTKINTNVFDVSPLTRGTYFVELQLSNNQTVIKKIIKK